MNSHSKGFDLIVVGAGVDGLVAASVAARRGLHVALVTGGGPAGAEDEVQERAGGLRFPLGWHGPRHLDPRVCKALELRPRVAPAPLLVVRGRERRDWVAPRSKSSKPGSLLLFQNLVERLAGPMASSGELSPPDPGDPPGAAESLRWAKVLMGARGLGEEDLYELIRFLPSPAQDLVEESALGPAESLAVVAPAIRSSALGPRSPGGGMRILHEAAWPSSAGALAGDRRFFDRPLPELLGETADRAGVVRFDQAAVEGLITRGDRVLGLALADGSELGADRVLATAGPGHVLLDWLGAQHLAPSLVQDLRSLRAEGSVAKLHLVLDAAPVADTDDTGWALLCDGLDQLERGADAVKYGRLPERPPLELHWAPGSRGRFAVSVLVDKVASRACESDEARETLRRTVLDTADSFLPGFADRVVEAETLGPRQLGELFGTPGGHLHHGDLVLDQGFGLRPTPALARYTTPIEGLFLGGPGCHPGRAGGLAGLNAVRRVLR